jgi:glycosyltransferase involved in cell wall biosynthesis
MTMIEGSNISVIVPCFNAEKYLRSTLESILGQTVLPRRIIVIDDGSEDASKEIAKTISPEIDVYSQTNQGCAAARNAGAELADTDWLTFLDADDTWTPDSLEVRLNAVRTGRDVDAVFGAVEQYICPKIDPELAKTLEAPDGVSTARAAGSMLIRQSAFQQAGKFDVQFRHAEMMDFSTRLAETDLNVVTIPDLVLRRRIHGGNKVLQKGAFNASVLRVLRKAAQRKSVKNSTP